MFQINLAGNLPTSEVPGETLPAGTAEKLRAAFEQAILALREIDPAIGGTLQGPSDDGSGFVVHAVDVPTAAEIRKRDTAAKKKAGPRGKTARKRQRKPTASKTARHVTRVAAGPSATADSTSSTAPAPRTPSEG